MKAVIIDPWSRELKTFVASVVRENSSVEVPPLLGAVGIHLRFAVEMGGLRELAAGGGPWRENRGFGSDELGLIVLGSTYRAVSSAGFTDIITPEDVFMWQQGNATVKAACGCLGAKSLRQVKPQKAFVYAPGKWLMFPLPTHGNSNCDTADAVLTGLRFLANSRGLLILAEGQSDSVSAWAIGGKPEGFEGCGSSWTYGLQPITECGLMERKELAELPVEHHQFKTPREESESQQPAQPAEVAVAD